MTKILPVYPAPTKLSSLHPVLRSEVLIGCKHLLPLPVVREGAGGRVLWKCGMRISDFKLKEVVHFPIGNPKSNPPSP
jgi:hypothetical protein